MKKQKIISEIIVDMYEMRASFTPPHKIINLGSGDTFDLQNLVQYNFITTMISRLSDKYNIKDDDVKSVLRDRAFKRLITK